MKSAGSEFVELRLTTSHARDLEIVSLGSHLLFNQVLPGVSPSTNLAYVFLNRLFSRYLPLFCPCSCSRANEFFHDRFWPLSTLNHQRFLALVKSSKL